MWVVDRRLTLFGCTSSALANPPPSPYRKKKQTKTARLQTADIKIKLKSRETIINKRSTDQRDKRKIKITRDENKSRGGTDERANQPIRKIVPLSVLPKKQFQLVFGVSHLHGADKRRAEEQKQQQQQEQKHGRTAKMNGELQW